MESDVLVDGINFIPQGTQIQNILFSLVVTKSCCIPLINDLPSQGKIVWSIDHIFSWDIGNWVLLVQLKKTDQELDSRFSSPACIMNETMMFVMMMRMRKDLLAEITAMT